MITVIIPTFNRPQILNEALQSLHLQTFKKIDVIVVNDGGEDVSETVHSWQDRLDIKFINLEENLGISNARNVAIDISEGKYIAFLDDDDIFLPDHLELAFNTLEEEGADFFYGGALVNKGRTDINDIRHTTPYKKTYPFCSDFLQIANYIHTGSIVVKNFKDTEVRFDTAFQCCEDWDLWFSLYKNLEYRFVYIDKITSVYHLYAGERGALNDAQKTSPTPFTIARQNFYKKWPPENNKIERYRVWFSELEKQRDQLIEKGYIISPYLFDELLILTNNRFINDKEMDITLIEDLLKKHTTLGEKNV